MKERRIYFSRYQTAADTNLRNICKTLKDQNLIHKYFICRFHCTNILLAEDSYPLKLRDINDLLHEFDGDALAKVRGIINDACDDDRSSILSHDDSGHME